MDNKWFAQQSVHENAAYNFILFTYAGGNTTSFVRWKDHMPDTYALYPVLYPGRGKRMREPCITDLRALAEQFAADNAELFAKPFVMFGHCTGSVIAYEVCRCVRHLYGKKPALFVISCGASPRTPFFDRDIRKCSDAEFLDLMLETGRIDEQTAKLQNFVQYYLPILKQDFIMVQQYHCDTSEKLNCRTDTITSAADTMVRPEQIADWQAFVSGKITDHPVSGGHFYFEQTPEKVCALLRDIMETADGTA